MAKRNRRTSTSRTKKAPSSARKGRSWTEASFEELEEYRVEHKISKKRMAELLEVTNSTYHNWARGVAVATPKTQARIRRIIESGPPPTNGSNGDSDATASPEVMEATGRIVESYLGSKPQGMTVDKLVALVREVRRALTQ